MPDLVRRRLVAGTLAAAAAPVTAAFGQAGSDPATSATETRTLHAQATLTETTMTTLFKIVTVKDEIVIGLTDAELDALGGRDAGAVARALKTRGELTAWQYAVRKAATGELEQAPRQKVGLLAHESLRVEPYPTPLAVRAHD
ncbi:hypothetical protein J2S22_001122 [Rhodoplanes tepidamans]|nr:MULTISPECIES: hypothetical protein [Rhodoplanes]MDQ0354205.1 hypothetical protein [Rhodoplanes tepidamans]